MCSRLSAEATACASSVLMERLTGTKDQQPNVALIGEEIEAKRLTLAEVVGELADAVEAKDGFAPVRGPTGDISYPAGNVEKLLTSMTENTKAYCQVLDCDNLLIYR